MSEFNDWYANEGPGCDADPPEDMDALHDDALDMRTCECGYILDPSETAPCGICRDEDATTCHACGGKGFYLGMMADLVYYRCRDCGSDFNANCMVGFAVTEGS